MVNTDQEKSLFIERMAREWHSRIRQKGTHVPLICLRSGSLGTLVLSNSPSTDTQIPHMSWTAAYHSNLEAHKIVDVTGAGNAWLGGFTAGLSVAVDHHGLDIRSPWTLKDIITAAQMGSVSACKFFFAFQHNCAIAHLRLSFYDRAAEPSPHGFV